MMLTVEDLNYWLWYHPNTGNFTWKRRPLRGGMSVKVGDYAGSINARHGRNPRRILTVKNERIYASRAAWMMTHGQELPRTVLVDHINGNTTDDRIDNLRLASPTQNVWNRVQREGSRFMLGVSKGQRGRFKARIQMPSGEKLNLGTWESEAEAHAAYMGAAAILHSEFWIGNRDPDFQKEAANRLARR